MAPAARLVGALTLCLVFGILTWFDFGRPLEAVDHKTRVIWLLLDAAAIAAAVFEIVHFSRTRRRASGTGG
jgi:hypothetical protein